MEEKQLFAQVLHLSDCHYLHDSQAGLSLKCRRECYYAIQDVYDIFSGNGEADKSSLIKKFLRAGWCFYGEGLDKRIEKLMDHGLSGHSDSALRQLLAKVDELSKERDKKIPIVVLDTGDLSAYGDDTSIFNGRRDILSKIESQFEGSEKINRIEIHGNHDAWPGGFPASKSSEEIHTHREYLRDKFYTESSPSGPLALEVPNSDSQVQIYHLNSVIHEALRNSLAYGEIKEDQYWREPTKLTPDDDTQVNSLLEHIGNHSTEGVRNLRVLLTHHPLDPSVPVSQPLGMILVECELCYGETLFD